MSDKVKTFKIQSIDDLPWQIEDYDALQQLEPEGTGIDEPGIDYDNVSGIKPDAGLYGFDEITDTSAQMVGNWGYVANNASQVALNLPVKADFGKRIIVSGKGAGGWKITQNAGQKIVFGSEETTEGTGGYLESTTQYDEVELICHEANNVWIVKSSIGNINIV